MHNAIGSSIINANIALPNYPSNNPVILMGHGFRHVHVLYCNKTLRNRDICLHLFFENKLISCSCRKRCHNSHVEDETG